MTNRPIHTTMPKMLMLGVHYLDVSGGGNPMPIGTACVLGSIIKFTPPHPLYLR